MNDVLAYRRIQSRFLKFIYKHFPRDYPRAFDKQLKNRIRARDGFSCVLCGVPQGNGRLLDVHHIDYNKKNLAQENLVSLCRFCHTKRPKKELFDRR